MTDDLAKAMVTARADAERCAEEVMAGTGWRKAPAQSPVACNLIKGRDTKEVIAILQAWSTAYQRRCFALADQLL